MREILGLKSGVWPGVEVVIRLMLVWVVLEALFQNLLVKEKKPYMEKCQGYSPAL